MGSSLRLNLRIFLAAAGMAVRGQLQYRRAFLVGFLAQMLTALTDIVAILVLTSRFHAIAGWRLPDLCLLYGLVSTSLSLAIFLVVGISRLQELVRTGQFDEIRIRPCSSLFLLAGRGFDCKRLGRVVQGVIVLVWSLVALHSISVCALLVTLIALVGGAALFTGIIIIEAACAFWTVEGLEIFNVATYGGETLGSYPVPVFHAMIQRILIGVIPIAGISYGPALLLTHRSTGGAGDVLLWCGPLAGILFLALSWLPWRLGLRRYASTGS